MQTGNEFVYDSSAGSGVTIYIVDTGFEPSDVPELKEPQRLRWLFVDNDEFTQPWKGTDEDKSDIESLHGTTMVVKAVSTDFGIAKLANVVVVRRPIPLPQYSEEEIMTFALFARTVRLLIKDVTENQLQGKFVVNYSWGMHPSLYRRRPLNWCFADIDLQPFPYYNEFLIRKFRELEALGAVLVTAAGNDGTNPVRTSFPKLHSYLSLSAKNTSTLYILHRHQRRMLTSYSLCEAYSL